MQSLVSCVVLQKLWEISSLALFFFKFKMKVVSVKLIWKENEVRPIQFYVFICYIRLEFRCVIYLSEGLNVKRTKGLVRICVFLGCIFWKGKSGGRILLCFYNFFYICFFVDVISVLVWKAEHELETGKETFCEIYPLRETSLEDFLPEILVAHLIHSDEGFERFISIMSCYLLCIKTRKKSKRSLFEK